MDTMKRLKEISINLANSREMLRLQVNNLAYIVDDIKKQIKGVEDELDIICSGTGACGCGDSACGGKGGGTGKTENS